MLSTPSTSLYENHRQPLRDDSFQSRRMQSMHSVFRIIPDVFAVVSSTVFIAAIVHFNQVIVLQIAVGRARLPLNHQRGWHCKNYNFFSSGARTMEDHKNSENARKPKNAIECLELSAQFKIVADVSRQLQFVKNLLVVSLRGTRLFFKTVGNVWTSARVQGGQKG
jgi:hypothetical protein